MHWQRKLVVQGVVFSWWSVLWRLMQAYQLFLLHDPRAADIWPEELQGLRQAARVIFCRKPGALKKTNTGVHQWVPISTMIQHLIWTFYPFLDTQHDQTFCAIFTALLVTENRLKPNWSLEVLDKVRLQVRQTTLLHGQWNWWFQNVINQRDPMFF